ncbi:MAG: transcriptional repressor LexA [Myxococcota bacterium]
MEKLTERQKEVYDFITLFIARNGFPPTIREICEGFGISSTNGANEHVKALERKGWVIRKKGQSRGIMPTKFIRTPEERIIRPSKHDENLVAIPLIGRIAAGEPVLAQENIEATLYFDSYLLGREKNTFLLKVTGDSMIGDGILDGDYVFIRPQSVAENGQLVAVLLNDSATIKRFYKGKDGIKLVPANPRYEPVIIPRKESAGVRVLGLVIGVYRKTTR